VIYIDHLIYLLFPWPCSIAAIALQLRSFWDRIIPEAYAAAAGKSGLKVTHFERKKTHCHSSHWGSKKHYPSTDWKNRKALAAAMENPSYGSWKPLHCHFTSSRFSRSSSSEVRFSPTFPPRRLDLFEPGSGKRHRFQCGFLSEQPEISCRLNGIFMGLNGLNERLYHRIFIRFNESSMGYSWDKMKI
jgi:hypothetical protein